MTLPRSGLRRSRNTKIVATIGPVSSSPEMIRRLLEAGVDVFRLNFSHGAHEDHAERYRAIRQMEEELNRPVAIMADLQGPKLRVGKFAEGKIELVPGQKFRLDLDPALGNTERVQLPHPEIFAALEDGTDLLLDDGNVRLRVISHGPDHAECEVTVGRKLSDRKGVNVPGVILPLDALTEKDRKDLEFAVELGVDWIAMSFVQRPEDIELGHSLIKGRAALLAKMEKPSAIKHLDEIVKLVDGMMVARGDLGVEMPAEEVPAIQKRIVRACRQAGKPVIVATQMLESMVNSPTPTRAEASDVATAVFDGADAVMLSAETAAGSYPVEAVSIMNRIAERVESDPIYRDMIDSNKVEPEHTLADAITASANQVAITIDAKCIVTYTSSGYTTLRACRERPHQPILCITPNFRVARRMMLSFGVHSVVNNESDHITKYGPVARDTAKALGFAKSGDSVVITAGVPFGQAGTTNMLRITTVD
ncbi:pyruvate kinase [Radicibacter daui]|uniref:pyruvate kinase n=1 Tax=Radicibacter daui TaxID=3064829 RepID=UPI00404693F0